MQVSHYYGELSIELIVCGWQWVLKATVHIFITVPTGLGVNKPATGLGLGLGTGLGTGLQLGQQQTGLSLGGLSQARCEWKIPCLCVNTQTCAIVLYLNLSTLYRL